MVFNSSMRPFQGQGTGANPVVRSKVYGRDQRATGIDSRPPISVR